jgi:3-oxoacyl-[acyl-carrier-protein] synthase-3
MLGCDTIGALDVRNQCSGFVYAMSVADAFIKVGQYKNILCGAEIHSFGLDFTDRGRGVSVIFGDGAGAIVLSASEDDSVQGFLQRICTPKDSMLMSFVQNSREQNTVECTFEKRT